MTINSMYILLELSLKKLNNDVKNFNCSNKTFLFVYKEDLSKYIYVTGNGNDYIMFEFLKIYSMTHPL